MTASYTIPGAIKTPPYCIPVTIEHRRQSSMEFVGEAFEMAPELYYRPLPPMPTFEDLKALHDMRVACGWYHNRIAVWISEVAANKRFVWFIHFASTDASGRMLSNSPPIGMISLYLENPYDSTLANFSQTGRVEITSLFIYAAYRHLGIGVAAIQEMESRAAAIGATHTTFNTMAVERHLRVFKEQLGYREYKAREVAYPAAEIVGAALPQDYQVAAFLEKQL